MNNREEQKRSKNHFWYIYGLILFVVFGISLALRIFPMHEAVFGSGWVNMQGVDGIYHLRLVENLLQHFPFRISFDPYTYFPYGQDVFFAPLFDLLAGFCAWVVGFGSPDQHTIETVAAYFPAVLGALVTIPVYFIGKTLWSRTAGLIAALIIGILPGTFLFRSKLGFFDHHVTEIFFSSAAILFLLLALEQVHKNPITFSNILHKDWKLLSRPLLYSCLSGIALGSYLLAWVGGLLFIFLFFCWAVIIFIVDHLKKQSTEYICIIGIPVFLLALLIVIPFLNQIAYSELYVFSVSIGLFVLILLTAISKMMKLKNVRGIYYPISIVGMGLVGFTVLYEFFPSIFNSILDKFQIFKPGENILTITEVKPLFFSGGKFAPARIWSEFTTSAIVAPIGFILLVVGIFKKISSGKILLILWTVLIFWATIGQVRFAAYLAVVFAVFSGYFYGELISWLNLLFKWLFSKPFKKASNTISYNKHRQREQAKDSSGQRRSHKQNNTKRHRFGVSWYQVLAVIISAILVFMVGIYPNIKPAIINAGSNAGITSEWRDSLLWMKDNTPEPFQNADFYYQLYEKPSSGKYEYPVSAYGVMAWWDYGHIITEIAHRIPNANPHQAGAENAARYFISQNESDANKILDKLGSKYIIVDYDIAIPFSIANDKIVGKKFYAMPTWAGTELSQYYDIFYQQKEGKLYPFPVYYPDYYYCLSTRLFCFHGAAVVPKNSTTVISFAQQSGRNVIKSSQTFATYEAAISFFEKQSSDNFRIVGTSPFNSPVPLEKLAHYQEVYRSHSGVSYNGQKSGSSYIEIFEYIP